MTPLSHALRRDACTSACPHLGCYEDPPTHCAYPSAANACFVGGAPRPLRRAFEAATCLTPGWPDCAHLRAGEGATGSAAPRRLPIGRRLLRLLTGGRVGSPPQRACTPPRRGPGGLR